VVPYDVAAIDNQAICDNIVGNINHVVRKGELVIWNVYSIDVSGTEDDVQDRLEGRESEESDGGHQKDCVADIPRPVEENVDADAKEDQVDAVEKSSDPHMADQVPELGHFQNSVEKDVN